MIRTVLLEGIKKVDSTFSITNTLKKKSYTKFLEATNIVEFNFEFYKNKLYPGLINYNSFISFLESSANSNILAPYKNTKDYNVIFLKFLSVLYCNKVFGKKIADKEDKKFIRTEILFNILNPDSPLTFIDINKGIYINKKSQYIEKVFEDIYNLSEEDGENLIPTVRKQSVLKTDSNILNINIFIINTKANRRFIKSLNILQDQLSKYKEDYINQAIISRTHKDTNLNLTTQHIFKTHRYGFNNGKLNTTSLTMTSRLIETIIFKEKYKLINHLENWLTSRDKFTNLGVPFKTGILIQGKPGVGKSSLSYAIAGLVSAGQIFHFDTNFIKNEGINGIYREIGSIFVTSSSPKVIIFDEFEKTVSELSEKEIADFCELFDSPTSPNNCIFIAITNDKIKIPEVLVRPGRFDLDITLDYFDKEDVVEYLETKGISDNIINTEFNYFLNTPEVKPAELQKAYLDYIRMKGENND